MKRVINIAVFISIIFNFCFSQERTTIAVYNLRSTSILTQDEVEILTNHLRSILINYQKYDCLDRNRMEEILKEQGFQQSGCTSQMCAVEAGQLLGVQKMLTGSVGKFGKLFTIELQIIDIETSKIDQSSTYYFEGEMEKLLTEGIKLSIEKLIGSEQITKKLDKPIPDTSIKKTEQVKPQEPEFGYITFRIEPSNARVVIDNKVVPRYKMDSYKIVAGTYDIQISRKGYKKYIDDISVGPGDKLIIEKSLELEEKPELTLSPDTGIIEYNSVPITKRRGNSYYFIGCGIPYDILTPYITYTTNLGINHNFNAKHAIDIEFIYMNPDYIDDYGDGYWDHFNIYCYGLSVRYKYTMQTFYNISINTGYGISYFHWFEDDHYYYDDNEITDNYSDVGIGFQIFLGLSRKFPITEKFYIEPLLDFGIKSVLLGPSLTIYFGLNMK